MHRLCSSLLASSLAFSPACTGVDGSSSQTATGDPTATGSTSTGPTSGVSTAETVSTADTSDDATGPGVDDGGSTSTGSTSDAGVTSDASTSNGSTSDAATSSGSGSEGSTSQGSTSQGSTSQGSTSDQATSGETGGQLVELSGVVVSAVSPAGDGVGTLYVGLSPTVDCFDGSSAYTDIIAAADLSEIGNEVPFSITADLVEVAGGDYLLQVFLDDDDDAVFEDPDSGDMIMTPRGFEEVAGCHVLGTIDQDMAGIIVELDAIF